MAHSQYKLQMAIQDFHSARQKAAIQEILARISGKSNQPLSYEEVAEKLKLNVRTERGIKTIPLDAIAGSVGRTTDFTRTFLPLRDDDRERWARVKAAFDNDPAGLPPIEVYKVGEVYFVIDGNHRVSIARQEKLGTIEAHVIEVPTSIPFTADMPPEELDALILQAELAEFLKETSIMELRPNVDLSVTCCYQYEKLREQIHLQEYLLQQERPEKVTFEEAVLDWYDQVYTPLAEVIRDRGLLRWFPGRSVTDFYLWICEYHAELEKETGWIINPETVATALSVQESSAARSHATATGSWRANKLIDRYVAKLFKDILIPLSGDENSWQSLEQAIVIAKQEGSRLHGLHVVGSAEDCTGDPALAVREKFNELCARSSVEGSLVIEAGEIVRRISTRARLADLTILNIDNPPQGGLASLKSPFRAVINEASGPILGLGGGARKLQRALVAFDGSPRSREALFVGTYLAEQWKTSLTIYTALENGRLSSSVLEVARTYLEFHETEAEFVLEKGPVSAIKQTLTEAGVDLLILGSYGRSMIREVFIGNTLDFVLRESPVPVLICR